MPMLASVQRSGEAECKKKVLRLIFFLTCVKLWFTTWFTTGFPLVYHSLMFLGLTVFICKRGHSNLT